MPTTVTSSTGTVYHLWQLPDLTTPTPEEGWRFTDLRNDLSDGFYSRRRLGSDAGLRTWKLAAPTLAALSVLSKTVTGINGAPVSRLNYVRSLFQQSNPFVYQSPINSQYYIVQFGDETLALKRAKVPIYATDINLDQVRISGETVFDISKVETTTYGYDWFNETGHGAFWNNLSGGDDLTVTGDVVFSANPQNGHNTVRFSGSASTGVLNANNFSQPIWDLFIVMKMREATFSNNAGVFTGSSDTSLLVGTNADTIFQNPTGIVGAFHYYKNGIEYTAANMQAPMNTWGVVRITSANAGFDPGLTVQMGKNQGTAGTFAKMDVGEVLSFAQPVPDMDAAEITEHLVTKWGIT